MGSDGLLRIDRAGGVSRLTLDSGHNRNALSTRLIDALVAALDDDTARVFVLDHTGPVFCSGVDLTEVDAAAARLGDLLAAVWESPKPVIACVRGPARAGGVGLIAAADLAVCDETASFACTEVRLGVVPAVISATVRRRVAPRSTAELFLTGEPFDGAYAATIGLVTAAVAGDRLDATVDRWVAAVLRGAPGALAGTKRLLDRPLGPTLREDLSALTELSVAYFTSPEGREGVLARRERRDPSWVPGG